MDNQLLNNWLLPPNPNLNSKITIGPVCFSVCLFACLFACLFVCLFVYLSACLFVCLPVCLFVFLSIYLDHYLLVVAFFITTLNITYSSCPKKNVSMLYALGK